MKNAFDQLRLHALRGVQPRYAQIWLGLGNMPPKRNAIAIDPARLPSDGDCMTLAGLDVILLFHGRSTRYWTLRRLCASIYDSGARRLMIVDLDYRKFAFLKMEGSAHDR